MEVHILTEILALLLAACLVALAVEWLKQPCTIAPAVGLESDFEYRGLFLMGSFAIVLTSLVLQGLSTKPLVKKLGIAG